MKLLINPDILDIWEDLNKSIVIKSKIKRHLYDINLRKINKKGYEKSIRFVNQIIMLEIETTTSNNKPVIIIQNIKIISNS
jgi:hypothetical protein